MIGWCYWITDRIYGLVIKYHSEKDQVEPMKNFMIKIALVVGLSLAANTGVLAAQNCFVDYKAKQSSGGLKLHYGVMKIPSQACSNNATAQKIVSKRLANNGWKLLRIMSTFDNSGLSQRQGNAGAYFLKY